jgi:hypothetical protein
VGVIQEDQRNLRNLKNQEEINKIKINIQNNSKIRIVLVLLILHLMKNINLQVGKLP